ncbi:unnamed protein product [Vitrella brassicaformis CCMP3155]|uniref:Uncharacterized protein n=2 Tax=Vitrella brassicaformis TaxID=1169539 RepID=A0A0G4FP97_VITBC|nr:unnamed protein product [Vitrella brassicaformis CCMP3155]|eukprot:CEM15828.1 unnamed protein product [Vitrella brassicaformis CCMP3155]
MSVTEVLCRSAELGDSQRITELLDDDVNPNFFSSRRLNRAALHLAAANGHADIVLMLLQAGASVDAIDRYGCTPLMAAATGFCPTRSVSCLRALLEHGADVSAVDSHGNTALHLACGNGCVSSVEILLEEAQPEWPGWGLLSPLHFAADAGCDAIVVMLLERGCDPNSVDACGMRPLHWAARGGHAGTCLTLMQKGADPTAQDFRSLTPADLALICRHFFVASIVEDFGRRKKKAALTQAAPEAPAAPSPAVALPPPPCTMPETQAHQNRPASFTARTEDRRSMPTSQLSTRPPFVPPLVLPVREGDVRIDMKKERKERPPPLGGWSCLCGGVLGLLAVVARLAFLWAEIGGRISYVGMNQCWVAGLARVGVTGTLGVPLLIFFVASLSAWCNLGARVTSSLCSLCGRCVKQDAPLTEIVVISHDTDREAEDPHRLQQSSTSCILRVLACPLVVIVVPTTYLLMILTTIFGVFGTKLNAVIPCAANTYLRLLFGAAGDEKADISARQNDTEDHQQSVDVDGAHVSLKLPPSLPSVNRPAAIGCVTMSTADSLILPPAPLQDKEVTPIKEEDDLNIDCPDSSPISRRVFPTSPPRPPMLSPTPHVNAYPLGNASPSSWASSLRTRFSFLPPVSPSNPPAGQPASQRLLSRLMALWGGNGQQNDKRAKHGADGNGRKPWLVFRYVLWQHRGSQLQSREREMRKRTEESDLDEGPVLPVAAKRLPMLQRLDDKKKREERIFEWFLSSLKHKQAVYRESLKGKNKGEPDSASAFPLCSALEWMIEQSDDLREDAFVIWRREFHKNCHFLDSNMGSDSAWCPLDIQHDTHSVIPPSLSQLLDGAVDTSSPRCAMPVSPSSFGWSTDRSNEDMIVPMGAEDLLRDGGDEPRKEEKKEQSSSSTAPKSPPLPPLVYLLPPRHHRTSSSKSGARRTKRGVKMGFFKRLPPPLGPSPTKDKKQQKDKQDAPVIEEAAESHHQGEEAKTQAEVEHIGVEQQYEGQTASRVSSSASSSPFGVSFAFVVSLLDALGGSLPFLVFALANEVLIHFHPSHPLPHPFNAGAHMDGCPSLIASLLPLWQHPISILSLAEKAIRGWVHVLMSVGGGEGEGEGSVADGHREWVLVPLCLSAVHGVVVLGWLAVWMLRRWCVKGKRGTR